MPNTDYRFQTKSYPNGKSALTVKDQDQNNQYGNKLSLYFIPKKIINNGQSNLDLYYQDIIFNNEKNLNLKRIPRSSSKVLGDSYLTNRTPFNKPFRYNYLFLYPALTVI